MSRQHKSTMFRKARRASIERKRGAFGTGKTPPPSNKKPGARPGLYTFDATRTLAGVLVRTIHTPRYGA